MSGFHGNRVHHQVVDGLIKECGVTSFIETGTHYGATTKHIAQRHPDLPVFSCEINDEYFRESSKRLQAFPNIKVFQESSEKFVARLVSEGVLGDLPMFFLDAHWHDYWPLKDEVSIVGSLPRFVLMVDDFAVPGRPWFETSAGGGGTIGVHRQAKDERPCAMSLIADSLPETCLVGYPTYTKKEAFQNPKAPHLVGHAVILQGVVLPEDLNDGMYEWGEKR
jgi:predicted O-methyltransferase YrrM